MFNNNFTYQLADIAIGYRFDSLSDEVITMAKYAMMDHIGLAIRGASEELSRILCLELFDKELDANHLIPGTFGEAYLPALAMLRASTSHAIDYDDTFQPAHGAHMGSVVVGSVLPLATKLGASGKDIITAIVTGYEVAGRVGSLLHGDHYLKGFHATGTIGVFGVASACAKLMGLDTNQMLTALGLAATQASGVKSTFGTMAKPFNAGKAAYNGMLAARLTAKGFTANLDGLEADRGYLEVFVGLPEAERQMAPATDFLILKNLFKFHAACHAIHPMIEATKQLMHEHRFKVDEVQAFQVEVATLGLKTASIDEPRTGLDCKFSFPQIAATVLCEIDTATDYAFADEILDNEKVNRTRQLITKIENPDFGPHESHVKITLKDGQQYKRYYNFRESFSDLEVIKPNLLKKFKICTGSLLGEEKIEALIQGILSLETMEDGLIFLDQNNFTQKDPKINYNELSN